MSLPCPSKDSPVVITGASSGIGEELAKQFAAHGYSLILVARRVEKLKLLATVLREEYQVEVNLRPCDLADRDQRTEFRKELEKWIFPFYVITQGLPLLVDCMNWMLIVNERKPS